MTGLVLPTSNNTDYTSDNSSKEPCTSTRNSIINFLATSMLYSEKTHPKMATDLQRLIKHLDNMFVPWIIIKGTLLGTIRNSKFIKWDDNVDIGVPDTSYDTLLSLNHNNFHKESNKILFVKGSDCSLNKQIGTKINIFRLSSIQHGQLLLSNDMATIVATTKGTLEGIPVNIPTTYDTYLNNMYGPTYMTTYDLWNDNMGTSNKGVPVLETELNEIHTGTVITFGTYDLFHEGHYNLLKRAAYLGSKVIVGVSSDNLNTKKKGRSPIFNEEFRSDLIRAFSFVDSTFLEESLDLKGDYIQKYGATKLVMGSDWFGRFDQFHTICDVIYLDRTASVSTTNLIHYIKTNDDL